MTDQYIDKAQQLIDMIETEHLDLMGGDHYLKNLNRPSELIHIAFLEEDEIWSLQLVEFENLRPLASPEEFDDEYTCFEVAVNRGFVTYHHLIQ